MKRNTPYLNMRVYIYIYIRKNKIYP